MYVAMHFAAAAQVLLLVGMQLSAVSYRLSALSCGRQQCAICAKKKLKADG
jgi:hypothetical protein